MTRIVPIAAASRAELHVLNNAHAVELSFHTRDEFDTLIARAFAGLATGDSAAFLLAFDETGDIPSRNYAWFKARYSRFVYIDRVVVAPSYRRKGIAAAFYAELTARARAAGQPMLCCEVNTDPPNPASDAFHARQGFTPVGEARLAETGKTVRYLAKTL